MGISLFMKKIGVVIFLAVLLLAFFVAQKLTDDSSTINGNVVLEEEQDIAKVQVSDEVIEEVEKGNEVRVYIKFKDSALGKRGIASDVKAEIEESINIRHEFSEKVSAIISEEELEELKINENIESIDIVGMRQIFLQDSVPLVNASNTWNLQVDESNLTGKGETVCILDTGVNFNHADLSGRNLTCIIDCVSGESCVENCSATDWHGHGTHVAGIVGANGNIKGVAKEVNLISVQVCNSEGGCAEDDTEAGIQWCVNNSEDYNISVISMSLGADCNDYPENCHSDYCDSVSPEANEINAAVAKNISVVIATGNDLNTTHISEPACIQNATPVASSTKPSEGIASYSNRNSLVLLVATGSGINSTYNNGAYTLMSGTSMATPHVSGAIAILNQYKRLEGNNILTPSQAEDALNDSGKRIYDSSSGLNYSRIDVYSTILNIDTSAPEVTMSSPANNLVSSNANQTFTCSSIDSLQLANLTIYVWNSSNALIGETNFNATDNSLLLSLNLTLENGTYKWNCLSYDAKGNSDYGSDSNYTIKIGTMSVSLDSPSNNTYKKVNLTNFSCSVNDSVANLTNLTLKLWNSQGTLVYNNTTSISGKSNQSNFSYNISSNAKYYWNCYIYDEQLNLLYADSNNTLTFDTISPVVTLSDPDDEDEVDSGSVAFKFSVTDASPIANCSLMIDGEVENTKTSITVNATNTITETMSEGDYDWEIKCYDLAGNYGISSDIILYVITSEDDEDDDDSGSGVSGTPSGAVYTISDEDFENGASKFMRTGDIMKFKLEGTAHTLKVDSVSAQQVKVTLSSDPIQLTLDLDETEKADLDSNNFYDVEVKYIEYKNTFANISIKQINEAVPIREIQTTSTGDAIGTGESTADNETAIFNIPEKISDTWGKMGKTGHIIFYIVLGALGLAFLGFLVYQNKERIMAKIPRIEISLKKRRMPKKGETL